MYVLGEHVLVEEVDEVACSVGLCFPFEVWREWSVVVLEFLKLFSLLFLLMLYPFFHRVDFAVLRVVPGVVEVVAVFWAPCVVCIVCGW